MSRVEQFSLAGHRRSVGAPIVAISQKDSDAAAAQGWVELVRSRQIVVPIARFGGVEYRVEDGGTVTGEPRQTRSHLLLVEGVEPAESLVRLSRVHEL